MSPFVKRGRKRDDSRGRYPSGQIRPEVFVTGGMYQRLRMISRDPALASHLGRLGFMGQLDPVEVATGNEIARRYGAFDKSMARRRFAKSPSYEIGRGKSHDGEETEKEKERTAIAIKKMTALQNEIEVLAKGTFPGLRTALEDLCVMDQMPSAGVMPAVRRALSRLADVLGIRAAMADRRSERRAARDRN